MRSRPPEPKGKLGAMTGYSFSTPVWDGGTWVTPEVTTVTRIGPARTANGPEDQPYQVPVQWDTIDWRAQEGQVRRMRQRIFTAAREQDWPKVRNLQKLLLRSRANTLVSVRQVTQRNTGRKTAGIDGEVALTPEARAQMAVRVHQSIASWRPRAVRRVYIPKASNRAKLRPLGIPVLMDRCHQQRVRPALEPEWDGFRPGRSCHVLAARLAGDTRLFFGGALCRWAAGGAASGVVGSGSDSIVGVPDDSRAVRAGQPDGQASAAGLPGVQGGDVVRRLLPAEGPPGRGGARAGSAPCPLPALPC